MESGKTTLAAGLVREGLAYLTDEAIAIEPATHVVKPYPKPLSIDRGSWSLFPDLRSLADPNGDETEQWQVAPQCVGRIGRACPINVIAFVQYTPWGETELVSITRPEALIELTKNTFRFDARPRASLDLLTEVVRAADCYRFTIADLQEAVELVFNLLGVTTTAQEPR